MQATGTYDPVALSVSVCKYVNNAPACAKTAARIEVLFGVEISTGPRNTVLDGNPNLQTDSMRPWSDYFTHSLPN